MEIPWKGLPSSNWSDSCCQFYLVAKKPTQCFVLIFFKGGDGFDAWGGITLERKKRTNIHAPLPRCCGGTCNPQFLCYWPCFKVGKALLAAKLVMGVLWSEGQKPEMVALHWICESVFCLVMLNVAVDWSAEWSNWCSCMLLQYRASKSTIVNRATLKGYRLEVLRDWWMSVTLSSRFCNTSSPIGTYQWKKCCLNATDSACFL